MNISKRRIKELESIPCIMGFKQLLEAKNLAGELELADKTILQYMSEVELFMRQAQIPCDQVPPKTQTLEWKRKADSMYSKKTRSKKYSAINHFLKLYHGLDWSLPLPKHAKRQHEPQPLTEKQVIDMVRVHEKGNEYTKGMLLFLGYQLACRAESLINIKLSDIDHGARTVLLRRTKGDKSRIVPLSKQSMAKLEEYIQKHRPEAKDQENMDYLFIQGRRRTRASYSYLRNAVKRAAFVLQIPTAVYPHLLRHSRIRELRSRGYSWEKIMALTGHSDIRSLADYIHSETIRGLQESLDLDEGSPTTLIPQSPEQLQMEMLKRENEKLRLELEVLQLKLQSGGIVNPEKTPKHNNIGYV